MSFPNILIALIALSISTQSFSQNYQTTHSGDINYFATSNLDYILATRTDSVEMIAADSVFYSYKTIRYDSLPMTPGIVDYHAGAPWYGKSVTIESNGINRFLNRYNEVISIETQAVLGDTFEIYTYPASGNIIYGTISLHDTLSVLGNLDSIKEISLFSNEPSFMLDGENFILSQNHGFVRLFPFYSFPRAYEKPAYYYPVGNDIVEPIELVGSEFPRVGITKLIGYEMYSMDVNDQIGIYQSHTCSPIFGSGFSYTMRTVVGRTDLGNNSVQFQFSNDGYGGGINPCWSTPQIGSPIVEHMDEYADYFLPEELYLEYPPDNSSIVFQTMNLSDHCGSMLVSKRIGRGFQWESDSIIQQAIEPSDIAEHALEGFGPIYYTGSDFSGSSMTYANMDGYIYYSKLGTEECGDATIGVEENEVNEFVLSPNPTEGLLSIESDTFIDKVEILNLTGKLVFESVVNGSDAQLELRTLTTGVYLVNVISGTEISTERMIIK